MRPLYLSVICICIGVCVVSAAGVHAGDATELQRWRDLSDEQLREELLKKGLTPEQAKQGAKYLRHQLGPRRTQKSSLPERQFLKLPKQATMDVLDDADPIKSQFIQVFTDEDHVTGVSLTNSTALQHAINQAGGFAFRYHPADFTVYGMTADGYFFQTVLHAAAPATLPTKDRPLNLKAFVIGQKHLPVTLFLHEIPAKGEDDEASRTSSRPSRPGKPGEEASESLMDFLEREAELVLTVTGKQDPARAEPNTLQRNTLASFVVVWERRQGYMFSLSRTQQPVIGKTLEW